MISKKGLMVVILVFFFSGIFFVTTMNNIVTADTNIVVNPSFESGTSNPLNWKCVTINGNTPIWADQSQNGLKSIKITVPGTTDVRSGYPQSDLIEAEPLQYYTFSAWGKTEDIGGTNAPIVRIVELDSNKQWLNVKNIPAFSTGTNDWTQKSMEFQTGPNTAYLYIYANIWYGHGTFWVDDVELTLSTSPPASPPASPLIFIGDFETGDRSQWSTISLKEGDIESSRFQIVTDPVRQGKYAAKFTVHSGDECWSTNSERTEVAVHSPKAPNEKEGDEYYYAWSTLLPSDWTPVSGWGVISQWHTIYPIRPAIALYLNSADSLYVGMCTGEATTTCTNLIDDKILSVMSKGKWHDFIVHIKWTTSDQGLVEIWHREEGTADFVEIYSKNNIPTLQWKSGDSSSSYYIYCLQTGLYRSPTAATQTLYQDGYRVGTTFESVLYS